MLSDTWLLTRNYWRIDHRADSRRARFMRIFSYAVVILFGIFLSGGIGLAAGDFVTNPAIPVQVRLGTLPGLLLTMVLVGTLVSGVNQAIRALYLTNDMELLFSAPIRTEAVMTAKLLSRLPGSVSITLILTIPALVAFGISAGLGPAFHIAGALALLLAPLFGLAAGALVAMLVVRVLPAQRVSEYLGAASIILGVLIAIAFQIPRLMRGGESEGLDPQTAEYLSSVFASLEGTPLPTMWAGQGLVDLAEGRIVSALGSLSLYFLLTAGLFFLTMLLANRLYLNGWLRMQGSGITRSGYTEQAGFFGSASVEVGIAVKDWLLRIRDARQLAGFVSGIIFAGFFGFMFLRPGSDESLLSVSQGDPTDFIDVLFSPGVVIAGIILYAGWITFNRAAMTSLSIEALSFYILKAAPVDPRTIFRSKVWGLIVPHAVLSLLMLLVAWFFLRYSALWLPYAWACLVIIGYGMITISTTMGFVYPRLDWDDPRRMTTTSGRWRNTLFVFLYGLLAITIAAAPFLLSVFYSGWAIPLILVGILLLAGMAWLIERWSVRRIARAWYDIELPA